LNSKEEIKVMNVGHTQLLPFRDRSGRRVLAIHDDLSLPTSSLLARSVLNKGPAMKVLLYLWSTLMEDVDSQRKGLVLVFWPRYVDHRIPQSHLQQDEATNTTMRTKKKNKNTKRMKRKTRESKCNNSNAESALVPDADSISMGKRFFEAIPIRMCSLHFCLPDTPFFRMTRHSFLLILGENYRTRVKTHQGESKSKC